MLRYVLLILVPLAATGCGVLPQVSHEPVIQNPFPQLRRVAVAPFFNLSDEPTVDGRQFAIAYYNELQATPGFEVVPISVVEGAIRQHRLSFNDSGLDARRLAQILDVDAVVVGSVTEFSPYYAPRCGLHVEWWAANPCFHPIPAGYGLPWGTPEEEYIPEPVVYEAEMALAAAQLKTQTPPYAKESPVMPAPGLLPAPSAAPMDEPSGGATAPPKSTTTSGTTVTAGADGPAGWPDARGFSPPGPSAAPPTCCPSNEPVLTHTRIYHGNDSDFMTALQNYAYFLDDARVGGAQGILQRSDEFVRFCCHLHISEMLSARGGGGQTRVVYRWSDNR